VGASLLIGAIAGTIVVFAVLFFDKIKIDDPVGATSVHLVCGVFGTLCVGLFAKEGVTSLSAVNGLFYGGGFGLLGVEALGVISVGAFVFLASCAVWLTIKAAIGIRVTAAEEIEGLDIGEHGNIAYPDFAANTQSLEDEDRLPGADYADVPGAVAVSPDEAVKVVNKARRGAKITKVTIITNPGRLSKLENALSHIGITGITIANVMGYGIQKGHTEAVYRGVSVESKLIPKIQVDIVICKVPVPVLVDAVKKALYTGNIGDGKIFIYDVEDVIRVRTGETGYDALQDEEEVK
jgi:Amt family ammonium transporter